MIYIDDHIEDFDLKEALAAVSSQRCAQALRYRHERDQRLSLAAYRLLQRVLRQEYGIDEAPRFVYDATGKPSLEGYPDIHFSLSHCREAVACAVADQPVGIDIETMEHYSDEIAAHVMNADELRQILASPNPAAAFTRLWTMKEAFFKLTGDDCDSDIKSMLASATDYRFTTQEHPKYIVTTCQR